MKNSLKFPKGIPEEGSEKNFEGITEGIPGENPKGVSGNTPEEVLGRILQQYAGISEGFSG